MLGILPFIAGAEGGFDIWWQLRTGQLIRESLALPPSDPFAFAGNAATWINHEWMSCVLFDLAWQGAGAWGLALLRALLFGAIMCVAWRVLTKLSGGLMMLPALWTAVVLVPVVGWFANLRPQSFSLLLFTIEILALEAARAGTRRALFAIPVVFALWVNLHGGVAIGVLAFACFGLSVLSRTEGETRDIRPMLLAAAMLSLAALFIQPYGTRLLAYLVQEMGAAHSHISEWAPPRGTQWLPVAALGPVPLLVAALYGCGRRRALFVLQCVITVAVMRHGRFLPFLALSGSFLLFAALPHLPKASPAADAECFLRRPRVLVPLVVLLTLWALPALGRLAISGPRFVSVQSLPVLSIDYLATHAVGSKLVLPLHWGGFALYKLWPKYRVAIDGRNVTAYRPDYVEAYNRAYVEGDAKTLLELAPGDTALLPPGKRITHELGSLAGWTTVHSDARAVVLARRGTSEAPAGEALATP